MPELPDLTVYTEHLEKRVLGAQLKNIRLTSPFLMRSVSPTIEETCPRDVLGVRRLAKQLVFELSDEYFAVIHLMISGRLQWLLNNRAKVFLGSLGIDFFEIFVTVSRAINHLLKSLCSFSKPVGQV